MIRIASNTIKIAAAAAICFFISINSAFADGLNISGDPSANAFTDPNFDSDFHVVRQAEANLKQAGMSLDVSRDENTRKWSGHVSNGYGGELDLRQLNQEQISAIRTELAGYAVVLDQFLKKYPLNSGQLQVSEDEFQKDANGNVLIIEGRAQLLPTSNYLVRPQKLQKIRALKDLVGNILPQISNYKR